MFVNRVVTMFLEGDYSFTDFHFVTECWKDDFILELLRWYDIKVKLIRRRKGEDNYPEWKQYYEQIVRILYYTVINRNIRDKISLKNIFRYFFEVEDDDPYRDDPDMISAEKLLKIYFYIVKKIGKKSYKKKDHNNYEKLYPFVGRWDNEMIKELYDHLSIVKENGIIVDCYPLWECDGEEEEESVTEDLEQDVKLLQEILDRLQNKVLTKLKEGVRK